MRYMTLAEQFRQEGYQKGKEEGHTIAEQRKLEGKLEAYKNVASRLLSQGLTNTQIATVTGLTVTEIEQLKSKSIF